MLLTCLCLLSTSMGANNRVLRTQYHKDNPDIIDLGTLDSIDVHEIYVVKFYNPS